MKVLKPFYDVVVIGLGHAGCEAALSASRLGAKVLGLSLSFRSIARMSCNPSIGGPGKSQIVREIDALGGEMGSAADDTFIHIRMLNSGKGPAVRAVRAQIDRKLYSKRMEETLRRQERLELHEGHVDRILTENGHVEGVIIDGERISCRSVILSTGTYLGGRTYIGEDVKDGGPDGFMGSSLTPSLKELGIKLMRFKTGTSPRIASSSIDYARMELQDGEDLLYGFSNIKKPAPRTQEACYVTYTNTQTHGIISSNIDRAPIFSGLIKGVGPRYCPSIEAKVVRFTNKARHQLFIEPIVRNGDEMYIAGLATSLPKDVQEEMLSTIPGLEKAVITKYGYAIEYDCVEPSQLNHHLEFRNIGGLFSAGQSNGTSGYEEAAAQGLIAGINAALQMRNEAQVELGRDQAYIGVLIDDLVMKGTEEPYRMMTARAEYRLSLRQDNADFRLTPISVGIGLANEERSSIFGKKTHLKKHLEDGEPPSEHNLSESEKWLLECTKENITLDKAYGGYIAKEKRLSEGFRKMEERKIPAGCDYMKMFRLSTEAREKFSDRKPSSIGEASRIPGISPADLTALIIHLKEGYRADGK